MTKTVTATFTPLQESLLVLSALHSELTSSDQCLPKSPEEDDADLKFVISNHILILVSSFLEEWRRFEGLGAFAEVRNTLRVASPFVRRIRQWSGLEKFRSALLAHPLRSMRGEFRVPFHVLRNITAPTSYAEMWLLGLCAINACEVAVRRHLDEHDIAVSILESLQGELPSRGIRTTDQLDDELARLEVESQEIELSV